MLLTFLKTDARGQKKGCIQFYNSPKLGPLHLESFQNTRQKTQQASTFQIRNTNPVPNPARHLSIDNPARHILHPSQDTKNPVRNSDQYFDSCNLQPCSPQVVVPRSSGGLIRVIITAGRELPLCQINELHTEPQTLHTLML